MKNGTTQKLPTFWEGTHPLDQLGRTLGKLIPPSGSVQDPALEKFRKASNAYYDLFNNGGCNRPQAIYAIFGVRKYQYSRFMNDTTASQIEDRMAAIVLAAFAEQTSKGNINITVNS